MNIFILSSFCASVSAIISLYQLNKKIRSEKVLQKKEHQDIKIIEGVVNSKHTFKAKYEIDDKNNIYFDTINEFIFAIYKIDRGTDTQIPITQYIRVGNMTIPQTHYIDSIDWETDVDTKTYPHKLDTLTFTSDLKSNPHGRKPLTNKHKIKFDKNIFEYPESCEMLDFSSSLYVKSNKCGLTNYLYRPDHLKIGYWGIKNDTFQHALIKYRLHQPYLVAIGDKKYIHDKFKKSFGFNKRILKLGLAGFTISTLIGYNSYDQFRYMQ